MSDPVITHTRQIDDLTLHDCPADSAMTLDEIEDRLVRVVQLQQLIWDAATLANELDLSASWMALEGVDDAVDRARKALQNLRNQHHDREAS